ncbi:carbohydrate esterase family 5 protein [Bipolaris maydis]|nr:carbohydrate esterase family 5 protein [Bipolaris maydis]KAJ6284136.1 carbohydrate esterase family 5 protein [Bipolaris maydis]
MSFSIRNTIALGALSALAAAQTTPPKLDAACADVVIFMARGNDAPYRDGRTFPFVEATCGKLIAEGKTCDHIDIQFDVTLGGDYCAQVAEGARNGISQITAFNQKCPCTHIVVNGYSQGAHVAGDVLGGPGGCSFVSNGLDSTSPAGKAIAAALLWGDVMHTANQPYNVLDGASKQKNPRASGDLARLNRYAPVLRAYCAAGDPVCAGGEIVADHLNYFELYTDEASSWVVSKINGVAPLPSCAASSSSSSSSVPTPTASVSASSVVQTPTASVSASSVVQTPTASVSASSVVQTPTASVSASSVVQTPTASVSASSVVQTPTASVSASSVVQTPTASVSASSVVQTPTASVSASSVVQTPTASVSASSVVAPIESSSAETPYPTSPATVSPFPPPVDYDACVLQVHVEYVYSHM